jgi:hypothetical protein
MIFSISLVNLNYEFETTDLRPPDVQLLPADGTRVQRLCRSRQKPSNPDMFAPEQGATMTVCHSVYHDHAYGPGLPTRLRRTSVYMSLYRL